MVRISGLMLCCLLALAAASCGKGGPEAGGDGTVFFRVAPTIAQAGTGGIGQTDSRAKVSGTFPIGATIGLRIAAPTASPPISPIYNHFFAVSNGSYWQYYLDNINAGDRLSGFSNWGVISVSGYYPYDSNAADLEAIPFRIATLNGSVAEATDATVATDYMVAGTLTHDMATPSSSSGLPMRFGHLMTAIELDVNRSISSVPSLTLIDVTFEISGGSPERKFMVSGTYDAINPDMDHMADNINPGDEATTMTVAYPASPVLTSNSVYTILLVIMPELRQTTGVDGTDDATVTMTFRFRDQDGSVYEFEEFAGGNPIVTFKLSDISNTGEDNGLLAGWSYKIRATLGTHTQFTAPPAGVPIVKNDPPTEDPNDEFVDI